MMDDPKQFFSDRDLAKRFGVTRATVWRWCQRGSIAQPVKLSSGCTRWRRSDVESFEADRAKAAA